MERVFNLETCYSLIKHQLSIADKLEHDERGQDGTLRDLFHLALMMP